MIVPPPSPLKCFELINGSEEKCISDTQKQSLHLSVASNKTIIELASKFLILQKDEEKKRDKELIYDSQTDYRMVLCLSYAWEYAFVIR